MIFEEKYDYQKEKLSTISFTKEKNINICSIRTNDFSEDIFYLKIISFTWKKSLNRDRKMCCLKFMTEIGYYKTEYFEYSYSPIIYKNICDFIKDEYIIENESLVKKIEMMEEFIACTPGGQDYLIAKENFESLSLQKS